MARTKRIHVNQHIIKRNRKNPDEANEPVITVKTYNSNDYGFTAEILGESRVMYRPDKPLSCGAVLWVETKDPVLIDGDLLIE